MQPNLVDMHTEHLGKYMCRVHEKHCGVMCSVDASRNSHYLCSVADEGSLKVRENLSGDHFSIARDIGAVALNETKSTEKRVLCTAQSWEQI